MIERIVLVELSHCGVLGSLHGKVSGHWLEVVMTENLATSLGLFSTTPGHHELFGNRDTLGRKHIIR